jgi:hypothetical protein
MAGPDPSIHFFVSRQRKEDVDARRKAGHDGRQTGYDKPHGVYHEPFADRTT